VIDHDVTLPDGRSASVAEYGDPAGRPVIHLHGAGSCRLEAEPLDEPGRERGLRILSLDRPGTGRTSAVPLTSLLGYVDDVRAVADALAVDRFTASGFSNGGMFALATAHVLGDRVERAVPINPTSPFYDAGVRTRLPWSARIAYALLARFPGKVASVALRNGGVPKGRSERFNPDRDLVAQPETHDLLTRIDAQPHSAECLTQELALTARPWGFDHTGIVQPVEFFTGEHDAGRTYADTWVSGLPDARLHTFTGGHLGFYAPAAAAAITEGMSAG